MVNVQARPASDISTGRAPCSGRADRRNDAASIKFGTGGSLDAGAALFERLDAALLSGWKVGFEEFERQSGDAATNTLVPIAHVEVDNVGREMVGAPDPL